MCHGFSGIQVTATSGHAKVTCTDPPQYGEIPSFRSTAQVLHPASKIHRYLPLEFWPAVQTPHGDGKFEAQNSSTNRSDGRAIVGQLHIQHVEHQYNDGTNKVLGEEFLVFAGHGNNDASPP